MQNLANAFYQNQIAAILFSTKLSNERVYAAIATASVVLVAAAGRLVSEPTRSIYQVLNVKIMIRKYLLTINN